MLVTNQNNHLSCENCSVKGKSMFRGMCPSELSTLTSSKSATYYKKGQILFNEGTWPLGVFCIQQGKVKVYNIGPDGKEMLIYICSEGDLLGYNAILSQRTYKLAAETLEDSKMCFIPKQEFMTAFNESSVLRNALLKIACQQEALLVDKITSLAQKTVRERLAATLLTLGNIYDEGASEIEINLSREDLANMVGTATESLIRLLNELKKDGLVEIKGRRVKLIDPEKLRRIANAA